LISKSTSEGENCSLCARMVPKGSLLLRKHENNRTICLPCLIEIAEMTIRQPVTVTQEDANRIKPDIDEPKTS
jgi:hypothetical protein